MKESFALWRTRESRELVTSETNEVIDKFKCKTSRWNIRSTNGAGAPKEKMFLTKLRKTLTLNNESHSKGNAVIERFV
ncbi:MAG: hypothetical protein ACEY26_00690 [Candidatus Hodgkinia cicadicola]